MVSRLFRTGSSRKCLEHPSILVQPSASRSEIQYSTTQYSTVQYSTIQCSVVQHNTPRRSEQAVASKGDSTNRFRRTRRVLTTAAVEHCTTDRALTRSCGPALSWSSSWWDCWVVLRPPPPPPPFPPPPPHSHPPPHTGNVGTHWKGAGGDQTS